MAWLTWWLDDDTRFLWTFVTTVTTLVLASQIVPWAWNRHLYGRWGVQGRRLDLLWLLGAARRDPHRIDIEHRTQAHREQLDASWTKLPAHRRRRTR